MYPSPRDADRALLALCHDITAQLDGGYTAEYDGTCVLLRNDEDVVLGAAFCGNPIGDRIAITAFPPPAANEWQRKQLKTKITTAVSRGAEAIAARIAHDLLPSYLDVLALVKIEITERQARLASRDQLSTRLEALIPSAKTATSYRPDHIALTAGNQWGNRNSAELRVSAHIGPDETKFDLEGCDQILAMRIAEAIADYDDRHRIDTTDGEGNAAPEPETHEKA